MPFQFSILRLSLIAVVFAVAFWFTSPLGLLLGISSAILVAVPLSGIVMIARPRDVMPMIRLLFYCGLGMFVGWASCPIVRPPYESGDEFRYMIIGAIIGAVIAWILNELFNSSPRA